MVIEQCKKKKKKKKPNVKKYLAKNIYTAV